MDQKFGVSYDEFQVIIFRNLVSERSVLLIKYLTASRKVYCSQNWGSNSKNTTLHKKIRTIIASLLITLSANKNFA